MMTDLEAFEEVKARLNDATLEDETIMRFCKAREFNVDKAEEMLRADIKWREELNMSSYLYWNPSTPKFEYRSEQYIQFTGLDFEGSPVIYAPMGRWETMKNLKLGLAVDVEEFTYSFLETVMHIMKQHQHKPVIYILDMADQSYWETFHIPSTRVVYRGFATFEKHYPETMKQTIILNADWLFNQVFKIVKPVLTGTTINKVQIFDSNRDEYIEALLKIMPPKAIPTCI